MLNAPYSTAANFNFAEPDDNTPASFLCRFGPYFVEIKLVQMYTREVLWYKSKFKSLLYN